MDGVREVLVLTIFKFSSFHPSLSRLYFGSHFEVILELEVAVVVTQAIKIAAWIEKAVHRSLGQPRRVPLGCPPAGPGGGF